MEIPDSLKEYKAQLEKTLSYTNKIKFVPSETKPWESKLGGCPYLEDKNDYPRGSDGRPMMFLAQINLSEMPKLEGFPEKGILQFYIDDDESYGYDKPCKVIFIEDYYMDEDRLLKENPFESDYEGYLPFEKSGKAIFSQEQEYIGSDCNGIEEIMDNISDESIIDEMYEFLDASGSKIGGYPCFVQNPPDFYEDGTAEVLLLQIDTDDGKGTCDIMFGDCGNCQFMISDADLKKKDFSDVRYDWACC